VESEQNRRKNRRENNSERQKKKEGIVEAKNRNDRLKIFSSL
jgi:hypothetical protein